MYRSATLQWTSRTPTWSALVVQVPAGADGSFARVGHTCRGETRIDLTVLEFCDISGLDTFLSAAERAATAGASLSLHHPRPNLARLLQLTGTGSLLATLPPVPVPATLPEVYGGPATADVLVPPRLLAA